MEVCVSEEERTWWWGVSFVDGEERERKTSELEIIKILYTHCVYIHGYCN